MLNDFKNGGVMSEIVRRLTDLEKFKRDHDVVFHASSSGGGSGDKYPMEFRLTPATADPMPSAGITSTTLYCTPYKGNQIALYVSSAWVVRTSSEFSLALGMMTADLPYDIYCYDNGGTPTLEKLAWTNATTRATAIALQDGIYVKSGDATRRYLGTICPSTTTEIKTLADRWDIYNLYNQNPVTLAKIYISSHTYSTASWRAWNNSQTNSQVSFVTGLKQDCIGVYRGHNTAVTGGGVAMGVNSTTAPSGAKGDQLNNAQDATSSDVFSFVPGYNYWCAVEQGTLTAARISTTLQIWA